MNEAGVAGSVAPRRRQPSVADAEQTRASDLRVRLEALRSEASLLRRVADDPVELVHPYASPGDREVAGLFCASLAYGRVDLFKPVLRRLLAAFGPSPRGFCLQLRERPSFEVFRGLVYRFNVGADLAQLAWAIGAALQAHGTLEALFLSELAREGTLQGALAGFTRWLREQPAQPVVAALGPPRALHHLLPDAGRGAASKRLLLYLRWMSRADDGVDLGAWRGLSPSRLLIPVDTHVARMARQLGLTGRRDLSWRTAEEITAALRQLDPDDPVKYDFALCHFGMSGACPLRRRAVTCGACQLLPVCVTGQRIVRLNDRRQTRGQLRGGS